MKQDSNRSRFSRNESITDSEFKSDKRNGTSLENLFRKNGNFRPFARRSIAHNRLFENSTAGV